MRARKQSGNAEPFLRAMARKIGHAAGALTKVTKELTGSVSSLPEAAKARPRGKSDQSNKRQSTIASSLPQTRKKVRKALAEKDAKKNTATGPAKLEAKSKSRSRRKR